MLSFIDGTHQASTMRLRLRRYDRLRGLKTESVLNDAGRPCKRCTTLCRKAGSATSECPPVTHINSGRCKVSASDLKTMDSLKSIITAYAISQKLTPFISMQNFVNAVYREEEREMVPTLKHFGVGSIPWSPIARGCECISAHIAMYF